MEQNSEDSGCLATRPIHRREGLVELHSAKPLRRSAERWWSIGFCGDEEDWAGARWKAKLFCGISVIKL